MAKFSDKDNLPLEDEALEKHIQLALAAQKPDNWVIDAFYQFYKRIFRPVIIGSENIPDQPCLFVANHSLFALDGYILAPIMMKELGLFPRGLGDRFLFTNPTLSDLIVKLGGVMGHPEVCKALMENGEDLIVFPGGAHEAVKPTREKYKLQWKERYGFVRLALEHGYTIQPFAIVGPDEFYGHLVEGEDIPDSIFGPLLRRLGLLDDNTRQDMLVPVPIGALGTLFPKPQRLFVGFGEPLDLADYAGKKHSKKFLTEIRDEVAEEINEQISELLLLREQRRGEDGLLRRILTL